MRNGALGGFLFRAVLLDPSCTTTTTTTFTSPWLRSEVGGMSRAARGVSRLLEGCTRSTVRQLGGEGDRILRARSTKTSTSPSPSRLTPPAPLLHIHTATRRENVHERGHHVIRTSLPRPRQLRLSIPRACGPSRCIRVRHAHACSHRRRRRGARTPHPGHTPSDCHWHCTPRASTARAAPAPPSPSQLPPLPSLLFLVLSYHTTPHRTACKASLHAGARWHSHHHRRRRAGAGEPRRTAPHRFESSVARARARPASQPV
ncbi:hypothetical protein BC628DRAFT_343960 [Trametes gibbosa]|nr:hypothetical protein BC628DRAFT_343960 [Trametes gibbosa]